MRIVTIMISLTILSVLILHSMIIILTALVVDASFVGSGAMLMGTVTRKNTNFSVASWRDQRRRRRHYDAGGGDATVRSTKTTMTQLNLSSRGSHRWNLNELGKPPFGFEKNDAEARNRRLVLYMKKDLETTTAYGLGRDDNADSFAKAYDNSRWSPELAEIWNGRFAQMSFVVVFLQELAQGKGVIQGLSEGNAVNVAGVALTMLCSVLVGGLFLFGPSGPDGEGTQGPSSTSPAGAAKMELSYFLERNQATIASMSPEGDVADGLVDTPDNGPTKLDLSYFRNRNKATIASISSSGGRADRGVQPSPSDSTKMDASKRTNRKRNQVTVSSISSSSGVAEGRVDTSPAVSTTMDLSYFVKRNQATIASMSASSGAGLEGNAVRTLGSHFNTIPKQARADSVKGVSAASTPPSPVRPTYDSSPPAIASKASHYSKAYDSSQWSPELAEVWNGRFAQLSIVVVLLQEVFQGKGVMNGIIEGDVVNLFGVALTAVSALLVGGSFLWRVNSNNANNGIGRSLSIVPPPDPGEFNFGSNTMARVNEWKPKTNQDFVPEKRSMLAAPSSAASSPSIASGPPRAAMQEKFIFSSDTLGKSLEGGFIETATTVQSPPVASRITSSQPPKTRGEFDVQELKSDGGVGNDKDHKPQPKSYSVTARSNHSHRQRSIAGSSYLESLSKLDEPVIK